MKIRLRGNMMVSGHLNKFVAYVCFEYAPVSLSFNSSQKLNRSPKFNFFVDSNSTLNSQRGFITMDFLFSLIVAFGISAILFAMSFTLTTVEITQYILFSTTRTYISSNKDYAEQEKAAINKYNSLLSSKSFGGLYSSGWFEISPATKLDFRGGPSGNSKDFNEPFKGSKDRNWFLGISAFLNAPVLSLNIPFMGSNEDGNGFKTRVNVFLIRESSSEECMNFMKDRSEALQKLKPFELFQAKAKDFMGKSYKMMEDNGC